MWVSDADPVSTLSCTRLQIFASIYMASIQKQNCKLACMHVVKNLTAMLILNTKAIAITFTFLKKPPNFLKNAVLRGQTLSGPVIIN